MEGSSAETRSKNFPESFIDCVASLVEGGRLTVLWGSADLVLVARAR